MIGLEYLKNAFRKSCSSYSFLTLSGEIICVETQKGSEFLSTVQTARFAQKYFPLENGDWVALNDPQSGGYSPFGINFVGRIQNVIWSVRVEGPAIWTKTEKWESAGLRLPPLPYKLKGQHNSQIPHIFLEKVLPFEKKISTEYEKLVSFISWKKASFEEKILEVYFEKSRKALTEKLSDTPWTEQTHKSRTRFGETLSTKVTINKDLLSVDLAGTSAPQSLGLTESMTESVVTYACVQAMSCKTFYNSGTEKYFQITKPRVSWLSVREPSYPAFVQFLSFPFVESHLKQLLLKMKFPVQDWKCSYDGWMQFQFPSGESMSTDDLQRNWGFKSTSFKLVRTEENSVVLELVKPCQLFRVESGEVEIHDLKPGAQFQLELSADSISLN
jgi:hypothetical protein